LLDRDETEQARDLGQKVLPLAREATQLRLEMRSGRGQAILAQTEDLCRRTRKLLDDIRAASS
jgi:hypothetical protein